MLYFKRFIKLPTPTQLGMSDNDYAMPSELFRNNPQETTWEMYFNKVKELHPIKFFFASTLPDFFMKIWWRYSQPFKNTYWFLIYHLHPKHRYHWLDLRQPKNTENVNDQYRYGWCDTDTRMLYAMFNLLVEFVEKEIKGQFPEWSPEDLAKMTNDEVLSIQKQMDGDKEVVEIYQYWKNGRAFLQAKEEVARSAWWSARKLAKGDKTPEVERLWEEWQSADKVCIDTENNILHRLIDIRHRLWT